MHKVIIVCVLFFLASCAIEDAQPTREKQLTIAQNFMNAQQKKLLQQMAKRRSIELTILDYSANSIRKAIQQNPWAPGFDLIMLDGLYAQSKLTGLSFQYTEPNYAYIPIGISYIPDSNLNVRYFNDLSTKYLWAAPENKAPSILNLHLAYAYRKKETNKKLDSSYKKLVRGLKDHKLSYDAYQLRNTILISTYASHLNVLKKAVKKREFIFGVHEPNQMFVDYMSLSIISQTSQYTTAMRFVRALHQMRDHNQYYRNLFGLIGPKEVNGLPAPSTLIKYIEK